MIVILSKLVSERITVSFPYMDEMDPLETIDSHEVVITVWMGIDPEPENLLWQNGEHHDQWVTHQIRDGLPGVIYLITANVTTSGSKFLTKQMKLAILPDDGLIPPLFGTTYTTELYPLETDGQVQNAFDQASGRLREMPFPLEMIQNAFASIIGSLFGGAQTYSYREDIQNALDTVSGSNEVKLHSYSMQEESIQNAFNISNGTLEVKLITYTAPSEDIQNALAQVSGTLT